MFLSSEEKKETLSNSSFKN